MYFKKVIYLKILFQLGKLSFVWAKQNTSAWLYNSVTSLWCLAQIFKNKTMFFNFPSYFSIKLTTFPSSIFEHKGS